jgi:hypothetical protein
MATTDVLITADTRGLVRTLEEFVDVTGKDAYFVANRAMKSMITDVIFITPPGNTNKEGETGGGSTEAKKRGEAVLESDIRRIIKPDSVFTEKRGRSSLAGVAAIKAYHQANRSKATGRVKGGSRAESKRSHANRVMSAPAADVERYIRQAKRKVGILRSGWVEAANRFKIQVPAWVRRHSGRGSIAVKVGGNGIQIEAENAVRYARGLRDIQRRINWVVMVQEQKTERQMEKILAKRVGSRSF